MNTCVCMCVFMCVFVCVSVCLCVCECVCVRCQSASVDGLRIGALIESYPFL